MSNIPTLTTWADEPTMLDSEGRPALVCWWATGPNDPKRRAGVVWPDGAWEVYLPDADPCGGKPVESRAAADKERGRDEARAALRRLCGRLRSRAEKTSNSKSGGPL